MKQILDSSRTVLIHDLDGVHYDFADIPERGAFFDRVKAEAGMRIFPELSYDDALKISLESALNHHNCITAFVPYALQRGVDPDEMVLKMHAEYHRLILEIISRDHTHILQGCKQTQDLFRQLKGFVRHGLLTQSCLENWAVPFLTRIDLLQYFEPEAVLGFIECGTKLKSTSTDPVTLALQRLDADPRQSLFIEDSLINLKTAKDHYPDLLTVYVDHGRATEDTQSYVDLRVPKVQALFNRMLPLYTSSSTQLQTGS